jgi:EAL domain-containing protein (putative c-di-GMP-specific phosphodiesterase class I)/GGDEF domain-containing protein
MAQRIFRQTLQIARALSYSAAAAACGLIGVLSQRTPGIALVAAAIVIGVALAGVKRARFERDAAHLAGVEPGAGLAASLPRLALRLRQLAGRENQIHPVTRLPTREKLTDIISSHIEAEGASAVLGVIRFADYDRLAGFDAVAANLALERFAARLLTAVGAGRTIAQIDRDGFGVWFAGQDLDTAAPELQAIAYVASQEIDLDETVLSPTVEIGTATYPQEGADATQLMLRATANLARPGVTDGQPQLTRPVSPEDARERFLLEQDLAQAIAADQLTMVFQPVVDLRAGRLIGAEALLRWNHPRLGAVSPAKFIPIVESMGLGERYGLWVLNAACREARRWRDLGHHDLKIAVNLSARQLLDPELRAKIERTLARHRLDARALELELTETAAMADAARTAALFGELRAMGVSLAIDDFGSGYSSLSYLKNLPFDKLKIDREFVTAVDQRRDSRAICAALIALGKGLDLQVLAEGVETEAEVAALRDLGCDVFQGYHFSKPLSADAFQRLAATPGWPASLASAPIQKGLQTA